MIKYPGDEAELKYSMIVSRNEFYQIIRKYSIDFKPSSQASIRRNVCV